jgi:GTPase SAR1 family protein
MENLNVFIIGLENAGKSTITNALIGTTLSKINTAKEHSFVVSGKYKESNMTQNEDEIIWKIPQYENSLLPKKLTITIYDSVGVIDKAKKHSTVVDFINNKSQCCDLLLSIFDINTFEEKQKKHLELLKSISNKMTDPCLHICVLNKCDSLVFLDSEYLMDANELEKFNKYKKVLNDHGCKNVVPMCAKKSMLFSAGMNGFFEKDQEKYNKLCYQSETQHGVDGLLVKYGLKNLSNMISSFVSEKYDSIVNKHVLSDLLYCNSHDPTILINIISRLINNNDEHINFVVQQMYDMMDTIVPTELKNIEESNIVKASFENLSYVFKEKTGCELIFSDKIDKVVYKMRKTHHLMKLKEKWNYESTEELYKMGELDKVIFFESVKTYITEDNIDTFVVYILMSTNYDQEYFYYTLSAFLEKFPVYIVLFKTAYPFTHSFFELIRLQLLDKYGGNYENSIKIIGLDVNKFNNMRHTFYNIVNKTVYQIQKSVELMMENQNIQEMHNVQPGDLESAGSTESSESN